MAKGRQKKKANKRKQQHEKNSSTILKSIEKKIKSAQSIKEFYEELKADKINYERNGYQPSKKFNEVYKIHAVLSAKIDKINELFTQVAANLNVLAADSVYQTAANELASDLLLCKTAYFENDVESNDKYDAFLANVKSSIANHAEDFKGNLGFLKTIANFITKLINLVLPEKNKFGFFEPKQTQAQAIIERFKSDLGLNEIDESSVEAAPVTVLS